MTWRGLYLLRPAEPRLDAAGCRQYAPAVTMLLLLAWLAAGPPWPPAVSQAPPDPAAIARIGAGLQSGSLPPDAAVRELKAILASDPASAQAHMLLGTAYRMLDRPELMGEARAELVQALALDAGLVPARFLLAHLYLHLGRPASARETLADGLARHPDEPQMLALLAEAERRLGDPRRAEALARQAFRADGSLLVARYYLALALLDLHRRDEAIAELEQVAAAGGNPSDTYYALGSAWLDAGRIPLAVQALGSAAEADPSRPDIRIALARALRLSGRTGPAREQLERARTSATSPGPGGQEPPAAAEFYLELGQLDLRQGRIAAAVSSFQRVLESDPGHADAQRLLAEASRRARPRAAAPGSPREK